MTIDFSLLLRGEMEKEISSLWRKMRPPHEVGLYGLRTGKVVRDKKGWVNPKMFLPERYNLVEVETIEGKKRHGWWTGKAWDGYRLLSYEKIKAWRDEVE